MHKTRLLRGLAVASALLVGLAGLANVARADKVGVAAAVNPDAFSTLAGAPQTQLNIGKSIFFNERINTTSSGLVQVLLVDGSTFTVGPGSDLVIDKFVYNPSKGTGDAIGNVVNSGKQYTATGDMSMGWDFARRAGLLTISDFDDKSFSGVMLAPGKVQFAGPLVGSNLIGTANGAFVGSPGHDRPPQGVIGNFGVGNSSYQATGIFGGTAQPH
jgi:hypothetical protein